METTRTDYITIAQTTEGPMPAHVRPGVAASLITAEQYFTSKDADMPVRDDRPDFFSLAPTVYVSPMQSRGTLRAGWYVNGERQS